MPTSRNHRVATLTITALCLAPVAAQSDTLTRPLFQPREGRDPMAGKMRTLRRSQPISIDPSALKELARLAPQRTPRVTIRLFPNLELTLELREHESLGERDRFQWFGGIAGKPSSSFVITAWDGAVAATFEPGDNEHVLAIQPAPGMHCVREIDSKKKSCGCEHAALPSGRQGGKQTPQSCNSDPATSLDVLIAYDRVAASQAGGTSQITAAAVHGITLSNRVCANSRIAQRFRLVRVMSVNYSGFQSMQTELERLRQPSDGFMDEVHANRIITRADLCALLVGDVQAHANTLGIAYLTSAVSSAFSVTEWNAINGYTLTHELGHNLGCGHDDRAGYRYYSKGGLWRGSKTVLTRNSVPGTRRPYFSNPDVRYNGTPTGTSTRNNARTISERGATVAQFGRTVAGLDRAPIVTRQPRSARVCIGYQTEPVMTLVAFGAERYQWYRNNQPVLGQTAPVLFRNRSLTEAHAGSYYCIASNSCGQRRSNRVNLTFSDCRTQFANGRGLVTQVGSVVVPIGDFDGDHYDDYAVGIPYAAAPQTRSGTVFVYSGRTNAELWTFSPGATNEEFGAAIAPAGDYDGDGRIDLVVGAPGAALGRGIVRVVSGRTKAILETIHGSQVSSRFGNAVAAGDLDGDGRVEIVVGAPDRTVTGKSGSVTVWRGRRLVGSATLTGARTEFGASLALGDFDRDGLDEILVGAPGYFGGTGRVQVLEFPALNPIMTRDGARNVDRLGRSVAVLPDVDGDGIPEVVAGAPGSSIGGTNAGYAMLVSFRTARITRVFYGAPNSRTGTSVASAGDFNRDGGPDVVVGAPGTNAAGGRVRIYSAKDGRILSTRDATRGYGTAVAMLLSNGDAVPDLLVGDPVFSSSRGIVWKYDGVVRTPPIAVEEFGKSCRASRGTFPRLEIRGLPQTGTNLGLDLYAATPRIPAGLLIGNARFDVDLGPFGAPGCFAYTLPLVQVWSTTSGSGTIDLSLPVPSSTGFVGRVLIANWLSFDPTANRLGFVSSQAAFLRFGR